MYAVRSAMAISARAESRNRAQQPVEKREADGAQEAADDPADDRAGQQTANTTSRKPIRLAARWEPT
jgi:hypothetical protein